jgi:protein O-mannosyl-transferase
VSPGHRQLGVVLPVFVFLSACAAFLPTLSNGFVSLDDPANLLNNLNVRGLARDNIRWAFTTSHNGAYQPFGWILFSAQYAAWGLKPVGYHAVSLILHGINAVLFYCVALRLLSLALPGTPRDPASALPFSAMLAAVLFAVHPLRTEVVAWVSAQAYLPVATFFLLTVLAYLKACRPDASRSQRTLWLLASAMAYLGSLLFKGLAAPLVVVLLILDVYPLRRLGPARPQGQLLPSAWAVLAEKTPFLLLGLCSAVMSLQSKKQAVAQPFSYSLSYRLVQAAWSAVFYLRKTLWPTGLSPWYQFSETARVWTTEVAVSLILFAAFTVLALVIRKRWPAGTALWACYLAILLPLSHLVRPRRLAATDRYTYLSCLGWALLVGAGLMIIGRAHRSGRLGRRAFLLTNAAAAAVCLALGALSWHQSGFWRDSLTLWTRAVEIAPEIPGPRSNLGEALRRGGHLDAAQAHLEAAIRLDPNDPVPRINLATTLLDRSRPEQAIDLLMTVSRTHPDQPDAQANLGAAHLTLGHVDEAAHCFRRAVALRPSEPSFHYNLAMALLNAHQYEEAISECRAALRVVPDMAIAHNLWGLALLGKGDAEGAVNHLRHALGIDPNCAGARANLQRILAAQGGKRP